MDQGGGIDGGKLTPLLSPEEPATWLVGARACLRPGGRGGLARLASALGSGWSGSTQKSEPHPR